VKKEDINCPPYAPVLMESTRAIGYSIESAVADIIDNSIAAKAKNIKIFFNCYPKPYIAICDDGQGMNDEKLTESMRYGSTNPSDVRSDDDLGRYGLGLKTASLSQCRSLTVISKLDSCYEGRRWDLDHIKATQKWSLEQLSEDEIVDVYEIYNLQNIDSGTLVLWTELDKIKSGSLTLEKSLEEKMENVKKHLELVFHRYLSGDGTGKIRMFINGVPLIPFDPFFVAKSTVVMDDEKIEILGREGKVIIRPYVLPHPSNMTKEELVKLGGKDGLRNLQGFYIYRNKRLLTWGTWFKLIRMDEFSKLARVRVDIPNSLDDLWTLDVKKSTAYPPDIVKTRLKQLVSTMANGSKRTWSFRQRKELQDNVVHVWEKVETREGVKYVVNMEHPILENLKDKLDADSQKLLNQYLQTVQNNLPFNNLHCDLSSDIKILHDKETDECERVKLMAKQIIRQAIKDDHFENTMQGFESIEPFLYYLDEIKEVCAEVKRNG
jgi:hypothetical protein